MISLFFKDKGKRKFVVKSSHVLVAVLGSRAQEASIRAFLEGAGAGPRAGKPF